MDPRKTKDIMGIFFDFLFNLVERIALGTTPVFDGATDDASRIGDKIWNGNDTTVVEDLFGFLGRRDVGSLQYQLALESASIVCVDNIRLGCRNKDIALKRLERIDWQHLSPGNPVTPWCSWICSQSSSTSKPFEL